jgi:hypothetical protein
MTERGPDLPFPDHIQDKCTRLDYPVNLFYFLIVINLDIFYSLYRISKRYAAMPYNVKTSLRSYRVDSFFCNSKIGKKTASTIPPTRNPITPIRIGSIMLVRLFTSAETWSS